MWIWDYGDGYEKVGGILCLCASMHGIADGSEWSALDSHAGARDIPSGMQL